MKIVLITPNYPPEHGACASRIRYMAQGLTALGHEVRVITALPNYPTGRIFSRFRGKMFLNQWIEGVKVLRYLVFPSNSPHLLPRIISMASLSLSVLFACFALRRFRPDFVLVQSPPLLLALSGWLLARFCRARFVLNVSDLWPRALADLGALQQGWVYRQSGQLELFLYRRAALCIGQSEEIIQHIRQKHSKGDTFLYRTGVDCRLFYPGQPRGNLKLRLVYAGLLGMAQGVLEICQQVNFADLNTEFHIYGDGYQRQVIAQFIAQHPGRGIFLHASLKQELIAEELRNYDAALIVQRGRLYGTVPSKIYEAMASGLPVLLTGLGESAEIVSRFEAGFIVAPGNYAALIEMIRQFCQLSAESRQVLGQNGRKAALQHFDRKHLLEKLRKKLESLFIPTH